MSLDIKHMIYYKFKHLTICFCEKNENRRFIFYYCYFNILLKLHTTIAEDDLLLLC